MNRILIGVTVALQFFIIGALYAEEVVNVDTNKVDAVTSASKLKRKEMRKNRGKSFDATVTFFDMSAVKSLIKNDNDTAFRINNLGLEDSINNYQGIHTLGFSLFKSVNRHLRLGTSFYYGRRGKDYAKDALYSDSVVNMIYRNGYAGITISGIFGKSKNFFTTEALIGGGLTYLTFYRTYANSELWYGSYFDRGAVKNAKATFFATDINIGYMHSFTKSFFFEINGGALLQTTRSGYYQTKSSANEFTTISPKVEVKFIKGIIPK